MNNDESFDEFNQYNEVINTSFCIFHQNIRNLRENFDSFCIYLVSLDKRPEVIVLTEIWISGVELFSYKLDGYKQFGKPNESYRAGGVVVYVSDLFSSRACIVDMIAADAIKITIDIGLDWSLSILAIYRLHLFHVRDFLAQLKDILNISTEKNLLIIGDINLCLLEQSRTVDEYLILMSSSGLNQVINAPTRGNRCIDHIFFRSRDSISFTSRVIKSGRSDHDVIVCNLSLQNIQNNENYNDKYVIKIDYNMLECLLVKETWSNVYSKHNASEAFGEFLQSFKDLVDNAKFVSVRKRSVRILKPWMTYELCCRQQFRNKLYKKVKRNPNNLNLRQRFDIYSICLKNDIITQKTNYYHNLFETNKNNTKKQWQIINEVIGFKNTRKAITCIERINGNGEMLEEPLLIAREFNTFFIGVVSKLMSSLDTVDGIDLSNYDSTFPKKYLLNSFFMLPTCENEVKTIINKLSSNKSPGMDGISARLIKFSSNYICSVLTHIINLSFATGEFPKDLKSAVVIPLFKKGQETDLNNYRPISLLSNFSKIIERIVKCRLLKFLSLNNLLSESQFGFVEKKSTEDALLDFCSKVYNGLNSKFQVAGLFIDITKAFDSVDHKILISCLSEAGIRGVPLNWFRSYLLERTQCVRINQSTSEFLPITCGVPQGSVLGPILFLVFVNSLCLGRFKGSLTSFADDTALCYQSHNVDSLFNDMEYDLNQLKVWFTLNKLALSSKTKYIKFSFKSKMNMNRNIYFRCKQCLNNSVNVTCINCVQIEKVDSLKYLGLILDQNCTWKPHVLSVKMYVYMALRKFYMLKYICPVPVLRSIYFAIVHSKIQYGLSCWGGTYTTIVNPIVIAQKAVIRQIFKLRKTEHSFPYFKQLNIFPLRHLYIYRVLRLFFVRSGQNVSNSLAKSIRLKSLNRVTLPRPNSEAFKKFYLYMASKLFNKVPFHISKATNLNHFSKYLKQWLFSFNSEQIEDYFMKQ